MSRLKALLLAAILYACIFNALHNNDILKLLRPEQQTPFQYEQVPEQQPPQQLSFVMPLLCRELPGAHLVLATMAAHIDHDAIHTIFLIPDQADLACIQRIRNVTVPSPDFLQSKLQIISSQSLLPQVWQVRAEYEQRAAAFYNKYHNPRDCPPRWIAYYFGLRQRRKGCWAGGYGYGYNLQMLLKLAVAAERQRDDSFIIATDWYVTLDADVLFLKPHTRAADFFDGHGRALCNWNEKRIIHDRWWYSAAQVLQTSENLIADYDDVIGVTPSVLNTEIVRNMTQYLTSLYNNQHWATTLLLQSTEWVWTEYTLYFTYARMQGLHHRYMSHGPSLYQFILRLTPSWKPPPAKQTVATVTQLFQWDHVTVEDALTTLRAHMPIGSLPDQLIQVPASGKR